MNSGLMKDAEIYMLNADELDVEELERRLEMAVSAPDTMLGYLCGADCGSNCVANGVCGVNVGSGGGGGGVGGGGISEISPSEV